MNAEWKTRGSKFELLVLYLIQISSFDVILEVLGKGFREEFRGLMNVRTGLKDHVTNTALISGIVSWNAMPFI